ncbi:MAG: DUF4416 family protein [Candidatus Latescibacterota bacterium]
MPLATRPAEPAAVVCAVLADTPATADLARQRLAALLGPAAGQTALYPFDYTAYYDEEMGAGLVKELVGFGDRLDPAGLGRLKRATMRLEVELATTAAGRLRRRANLDPGLVTVESLVLATTKYTGHRVCIGPDLYAEVTLLYAQGAYRPLPWTYPDYRRDDVQALLQGLRAALLAERRLRQQGR